MKRFLRYVGVSVAVLAGVTVIVVIGVFARSEAVLRKEHHASVVPPVVSADSDALARGAYLAVTRGCVDCHGEGLGGATVIDDPAMGRVYAPNLTSGRGSAVTGYLDTDWERAIRHGIGRDGRGLLIMPSMDYTHLSLSDMGALIGWLKQLPPVDRDRVPNRAGPVMRMLLAIGGLKPDAARIDHAHVKPMNVEPARSVAYGEYVARNCIGCHRPDFSGGRIAAGAPDWPPAPNLTPAGDGGFATWSFEEFKTVLKEGRRPDGRILHPAMPRVFGYLDDTEMPALWMYLQTLPPATSGGS